MFTLSSFLSICESDFLTFRFFLFKLDFLLLLYSTVVMTQ